MHLVHVRVFPNQAHFHSPIAIAHAFAGMSNAKTLSVCAEKTYKANVNTSVFIGLWIVEGPDLPKPFIHLIYKTYHFEISTLY